MIEYGEKTIEQITADTIRTARTITAGAKKYIRVCAGYDTETTRKENKSYIYHFAISFNKSVFGFRTWERFLKWLDFLNRKCAEKFRQVKRKPTIILWVANLSFEFQFLKDRLNFDVFATAPRQPLTIQYDYIQFRECLKISGGNLAFLAKTYCKTQKMVGDLDYTKQRNSKTPLNEKELQYIENDVVILSEWAEYVFSNVGAWGVMPFTSTGILRQECKAEIKGSKQYKRFIKESYFDELEYKVYMHYLFRGGYTHANRAFAGLILSGDTEVESWDKKSSYPSMMLQNEFAAEKFRDAVYSRELLDKYSCILDIEFEKINSTSMHSIESNHKIIDCINPKWDNGRLISAEKVHVLLTEYDFKIYEKFYKWECMRVYSCKIARKKPLPEFLINKVLKYFNQKENSKSDPLLYAISKTRVNAFYGMCVTRHHFTETVYKNGEWQEEKAKNQKTGEPKTFSDFVENDFLLPIWGIQITAAARYDLLMQVWENKHHVVYCDTDSIYFTKGYNKEKLLAHNDKLKAMNRAGKQAAFEKLGCYEFEGRYKRFKTLGAKRYIKELYLSDIPKKKYKISNIYPGVHNKHKSYYLTLTNQKQTIAGLGKTALVEYANKNKLDMFEVFNEKMLIPELYTQKLTTHYEDTPHSDIINGELMQELSSVSLMPSDFRLHFDRHYLAYLLMKREERKYD